MNDIPAPIWVLAAPFSGSAWFTACLAQHPDLLALPELDALLADTVGDLLDIFAIGQGTQGQGLKRAIARIEFGRHDNRGIELAQRWLAANRNLATQNLIEHLAAKVAPKRLVIAERDAVLRPSALRRLTQDFPCSSIIHLVRHPWTQGVLLSQWAREQIYVSSDFKDHAQEPPQVEPQLPWLRANQNIANLCASQTGIPFQRVRLEDAQHQAARTFAELCSRLGLAFSDDVLTLMQQPQKWEFAQRGPDLASEGLEAEAYAKVSRDTLALANTPRFGSKLPWRRDGSGFHAEVIQLAQTLGYAETPPR